MANITLDMRGDFYARYNDQKSNDTITVITDNGRYVFSGFFLEKMQTSIDPSCPVMETELCIRALNFNAEDNNRSAEGDNYIEDFSSL